MQFISLYNDFPKIGKKNYPINTILENLINFTLGSHSGSQAVLTGNLKLALIERLPVT